MIIKSPVCYDTSHWKIVPDFSAVSPFPYLVLTKATEGLSYTDDTFIKYANDIKQDGILRGFYHFYRKAYDPTKQAQFFCNTIRPYVNQKDIIVFDVEEGGETAAQLMTFSKYVIAQFPNNLYMIYSRKNILDSIVMTAAQATFFKTIKIWTAGYPVNPDLYNSVPSFYAPDRNRWGEVWLWQYTDKGQVNGISGDVDCNWIAPALVEYLGAATPPPAPADVIAPLYNGTRIIGSRYGWKFSLLIFDPKLIRMEVRHPSPNAIGTEMAKTYNAPIAVNGGEPTKDGSAPEDYSVSFGKVYVERKTARPSLVISKTGEVTIRHTSNETDYHALTGLRYIVGALAESLDGTEPKYTEGHSRKIFALTADGKVLTMTSEGRYPNQGLTLKQSAELVKQYGAVIAFDSGGGGDTTEVINGTLTNTPEDISGGINVQRALPQFLLIYPQQETSNMATRYTATAITADTRLRPNHNTNDPYLKLYPVGTKFNGDELYILPDDVIVGGVLLQKKGDVWLKVIDVNGTVAAGWVAVTHKGATITSLFENTPPPTTGHKVEVFIDGVLEFTKILD